jgi:hypothetical protein
MSVERVNDLEREFRTVNHHMAYPFDLADHSQLKNRRAAIIEEVREIVRTTDLSEPEWCRTAL